jgi:hypothetical protein
MQMLAVRPLVGLGIVHCNIRLAARAGAVAAFGLLMVLWFLLPLFLRWHVSPTGRGTQLGKRPPTTAGTS